MEYYSSGKLVKKLSYSYDAGGNIKTNTTVVYSKSGEAGSPDVGQSGYHLNKVDYVLKLYIKLEQEVEYMNDILKKLGLKDQNPVFVINAPEKYNEILRDAGVDVHSKIDGQYKFIQINVKNLAEVAGIAWLIQL